MEKTETYLEYLKSPEAQAVFRLSQAVTDSLREYLRTCGFVEFLPPVVSSVTDPGLRGAERLPVSLYETRAYVMSSMVFHKQVLATAFSRIYSFSPNVRLEPARNADSGRHLVEFCQLDLEEAGASLDDSMRLAEDMIVATVSSVLDRCRPFLDALDRDLSVPKVPFQRITYDDALREAAKYDLEIRYGDELPQALEAQISREAGGFLWVTDYPKSCRSFYYRQSEDGGSVRSMDLLYPEGFGEAISGGEREYRPDVITKRILEAGLDPAEFREFLAMADTGLRPTSGFGIGIERLVRYIAGESEIARVRPFPKTPGRITM